MRSKNSFNKKSTRKASPKIIDTVKLNGRYFDLETVKEKVTGLISITGIFICVVTFSFLFFL